MLIILLAETLAGQSTALGGLTGTVIDATNRVVPDATVELRNTANGTLKAAKTDADGNYLFSFLLPGNYVLKVIHPGLKTTTHRKENDLDGIEQSLHTRYTRLHR